MKQLRIYLILFLLNFSVAASAASNGSNDQGNGNNSSVAGNPPPSSPVPNAPAPPSQPAAVPVTSPAPPPTTVAPTTAPAPAPTPAVAAIVAIPANLQNSPDAPIDGSAPQEVGVPVKAKGADGEVGGVVSMAPNETPANPNALTILRQELMRLGYNEQKENERLGVFRSVNKRFTGDYYTFFFAIGAVQFITALDKAHGDPLALERHIKSLKDPISYLSFYTFMQSQGFYMNFHSNNPALSRMDPTTKAQMMRRFSYQGIAVGSFVSSIVADMGHTVISCVDQWFKGKTDEKSLASCNQAWAQWTYRNKSLQFFPQIITLWSSQYLSELFESTFRNGVVKASGKGWIKNILENKALVNKAYRIVGMEALMDVGTGSFVLKGIKFVGKFARFFGFMYIDHYTQALTRPANNFIQSKAFVMDISEINALWGVADYYGWNGQLATKAQDLFADEASRTSKPKYYMPFSNRLAAKFSEEIENYGTQMQRWRDHLNQDSEADMAGWMEVTKQILNQVDYSYKYYKGFVDHLLKTLEVGHKINLKKLPPIAAEGISRYPLRALPFYGVKPGFDGEVAFGALDDKYTDDLFNLEPKQRAHVIAVADRFEKNYPNSKIPGELADFYEILQKLKSGNDLRMASGLNDINQRLATYQRTRQFNSKSNPTPNSVSGDYAKVLIEIRKELGEPYPSIYPFAGYSQAFAIYSANKEIEGIADFSIWSKANYVGFDKSADLMLYNLLCASPKSVLQKYETSWNELAYWRPQFQSPSLIKKNAETEEYCKNIANTNLLYTQKTKSGKDLQSLILENIDYSVLGDYREEKPKDNFENWWQNSAKVPLESEFKIMDQKFRGAYKLAMDNMFDRKSFYKWLVDETFNDSAYTPKSLRESLLVEANFYLQIIARAMMDENVRFPTKELAPYSKDFILTTYQKFDQNMHRSVTDWSIGSILTFWNLGGNLMEAVQSKDQRFNYMHFSAVNTKDGNFKTLYGAATPEVQRLYQLYNDYFMFLYNKDVNFDQYLAFSKKINNALNDVAVKMGMKTKQVDTGDGKPEDFSKPAPAATSTTFKYEDVKLDRPTFKQVAVGAASKGLARVESEIRRFIRMRIALSQSLELDTKEFMADWNNNLNTNKPRAQGANPTRGGQ